MDKTLCFLYYQHSNSNHEVCMQIDGVSRENRVYRHTRKWKREKRAKDKDLRSLRADRDRIRRANKPKKRKQKYCEKERVYLSQIPTSLEERSLFRVTCRKCLMELPANRFCICHSKKKGPFYSRRCKKCQTIKKVKKRKNKIIFYMK